MPFHEETNNKIITLQLSMGKVPEFPKVQHDSWANIEGPLRKLGQSCVIVNQSNRPSIQEIIEQLRYYLLDFMNLQPTFNLFSLQNFERYIYYRVPFLYDRSTVFLNKRTAHAQAEGAS